MLVAINEQERAIPYFHAILNMTDNSENITDIVTDQSTINNNIINRNYFTVSRRTISDIQSKPTYGTSIARWRPKTLDDAKIGALVQLSTIALQQAKVKDLVKKFKDAADANPTDVNAHVTLARLYNLLQYHDKADTVIDKLIDITTNDTAYRYLRLQRVLDEDLTPDKFRERIAELPSITPEDRLQYMAKYAESLFRNGDEDQAYQILSEIEGEKLPILTPSMLL